MEVGDLVKISSQQAVGHNLVAVTTRPLSSFINPSSSPFYMAQPQPIIHHPFHDDHPMPSPPYSSFNPASYTRSFLGSPISWRPGSFGNGNRYYPGTSPGQLLGPLEYASYIFPPTPSPSHIFSPSPTDLRGAGKISSSIESDRGSIMNALSAMEREDELVSNTTPRHAFPVAK